MMYVLSLRQPWAWLVVCGLKRIETRSWSTRVRKPIAIHASSTFGLEEQQKCYETFFSQALLETGVPSPDALPLGQVIGRVNLEDCVEMGSIHFPLGEVSRHKLLTDRELAFGVYAPKRFAWMLSNAVCYEPHHRIVMPGKMGLFKVDGDVLLGRRPPPAEDAQGR